MEGEKRGGAILCLQQSRHPPGSRAGGGGSLPVVPKALNIDGLCQPLPDWFVRPPTCKGALGQPERWAAVAQG